MRMRIERVAVSVAAGVVPLVEELSWQITEIMFLLLAAEEEKAMAKKKLQSAAAAAAAAIAGFDQPEEYKQEAEEGWGDSWQLERSPSGHWAIDRLDGTQLHSNAARHFSFGQFPWQI